MTAVAGVDGCRGGWMVVRWSGGSLGAEIMTSFREVLQRTEDCAVVAVDMPIGLPVTSGPGGRACDAAARAVLGARQSSLFAVPSRGAVQQSDFAAAGQVALTSSEPPRRVSKQCFNLFPKIREIDATMTPALQRRVKECHPECAFWAMNGERPLALPKRVKSRPHPPGLDARRVLLAAAGLPIGALTSPGRSLAIAGEDDLLDACACAWTAARIRAGTARRFPASPSQDARGLDMEIWA